MKELFKKKVKETTKEDVQKNIEMANNSELIVIEEVITEVPADISQNITSEENAIDNALQSSIFNTETS